MSRAARGHTVEAPRADPQFERPVVGTTETARLPGHLAGERLLHGDIPVVI
jgi:hypothetical protein